MVCLSSLAACTNVPPPPIPVHIESRPKCALIECQLPARPALVTNDDWRRAVDDLEDNLLACAVQVKGCIELQKQKSP
ncbi:Rz1-like lysis system protein LysC [Denitrificimonas caeni]|uniref:Rz1-like lysis system protein LysC n=1 Tax=Denitrificimonas caeni TaxID=521720 RepID=UPI003B2871E2